jgi:hypothetical protein
MTKEITKSLLKNETCDTCIFKFKKNCSCPELTCSGYFKAIEMSWEQLNGTKHHGIIVDIEDDAFYIYCDIHNKECCCSL